MHVASDRNVWMIPPQFGLWIPARTPHQLRMPESVSLRTLYLRPGITDLKPNCSVLQVGPLLRELIFEAVRVGALRREHRLESALSDLLVVKINAARPVPTGVALPTDPRALKVAWEVIHNPAARIPLKSLCATAGVSVRTLERLFAREVGTAFDHWQRQVRLMKAAELLVPGRRVKEVAFQVGDRHPSSLVALFRQTFGEPPGRWMTRH